MKELFLLDPEVIFLNHGSFGACPLPVFEAYQRYQLEVERRPVELLKRRYRNLLDGARERLAPLTESVFGLQEPGAGFVLDPAVHGEAALWDKFPQKGPACTLRRSLPRPGSVRRARDRGPNPFLTVGSFMRSPHRLAAAVSSVDMNELTVAFAGVVAGGVVGVTAPVMTWLVALGNRRADRRPANAVNDPTPLQPER